jgi:hypothetical protein
MVPRLFPQLSQKQTQSKSNQFFPINLKLGGTTSSLMHFKQPHNNMHKCPSLIQVDNYQCKGAHPTSKHDLEIKTTRNNNYRF